MARTLPTPPTVAWPPAQMRAAAACGRLSALGLVEGPPLLAAIYRTARKATPALDPVGLRLRLVWTARDAASAARAERTATEDAIWRALKPELEARAPAARLLAVAEAQNAADPPLLNRAEVQAIVERAVAVHLAKLKREGAR